MEQGEGTTEKKDFQSKLDPYGFERAQDFDYKTYEEFMASYLSVLARRASQWANLLGPNKNSIKRSAALKRYVRKGIPAEHRPEVWMIVSGAEERRKANPDLYQTLLKGPHSPEIEDVIKTDIPRTFPDNIYFQDVQDPQAKRGPLYNVLLALAHNNTRIGYCQGLNFIAGLLLLVVKDEDKVFWLMDTLVNRILPDYYAQDMMGVKIDSEVLGELVKVKMPDVARFLDACGCAYSIICTKWFICLFADVMPTETVLRIWDALFYEGNKVLLRVAIALIKINRQKILQCKNFPEVMDLFKHCCADASVVNCHSFMQNAFKDVGSFPGAQVSKFREKNLLMFQKEG